MKYQHLFTAAAVAAAFGFAPGAQAFAQASEGVTEVQIAAMSYEELDRNVRQHNKLIAAIKEDGETSDRQMRRLDEAMQSRAAFETELESRPEHHQSRAQAEAGARASATPGRKTDPNPAQPRQDGPGDAASAAAAMRNGVVFNAGTKDFSAKLFAAPRAPATEIKPADYFNALATRTFVPGMINNATATEGIGVDGGFDVPEVWYRGVIDQALQGSEFAQRCRVFPAESNNLTIPMLDTASRNTGVAGLLANWAGENSEQTAQVMKWRAVAMKLRKTFILSEASSELVEDGISYEAQLTSGMSIATAQTLDAGILYGTGVGQPLGILNSPGAIEIAKEGSQTADTIVWENLVKMYSRLAPGCQKRATWFCSPQSLPSLMAVKVPGTDAPALLSGGFNDAGAGAPAMSIFGRPVVVTEICPSVGDVGDIVFADMSQYGLLMKRSARMENSNAPGFDRDVISFRMIMRVDGLPLWDTPITPHNGGTTLTWATFLAVRA